MSYLAKELRIMAGMITMCERIAFGRDSALMERAADEIERLQRMKAELRAAMANQQDLIEALENGSEKLEQENAELKAQVKMLRMRLGDILEDMQLSLALTENDCDIWKGRIKDTLSTKPAQCLAEVKAQAVEEYCASFESMCVNQLNGDDVSQEMIDGWKAGIMDCRIAGRKYANQIRQQAKAGING